MTGRTPMHLASSLLASRALLPAALVLLSLGLNVLGINWGQPAGTDWDFDSIAGMPSVKEAQYLHGEWRHKYPPVHFFLNDLLYRPFLAFWFPSRAQVPLSDARVLADPELARRFGILIVASRLMSAAMGAASVLAVYLTGLILLNDRRAAALAALSLALCQMFVFYAHMGNIDVPSSFWFAWAVYGAARVMRDGRLGGFLFTGVCAALAIGTKDSAAGFVVGLAGALALGLAARATPSPSRDLSRFVSWFSVKAFAGVAIFLLCLALINGAFGGWDLMLRRVGHWVDGPGTLDYSTAFTTQTALLRRAGADILVSWGWPLTTAAALALLYSAVRVPVVAAFAVLPVLAFHLIVVMNARLSAPRFFLPGFITLALVLGAGCAAWSRWARVPAWLRGGSLGLLFALSFLYCLALDLEMRDDTRVRAERWFHDHVPAGTRVAALCPANLSPRLHLTGYRLSWLFGRPTRRSVIETPEPYPYLILSQKYFTSPELFDADFLRALLHGDAGYRIEVTFRKRYLPPSGNLMGIAGWPRPWLDQVSPTVHVLSRVEQPPATP